MAFRWRADDGPTLSAGLVVWIRSSIAKKSYIFVIFQGGGGSPTPCPTLRIRAWDRTMYTYTENPFYRAYRLLYNTLRTFYCMHKFLN